ncbi:MAG: peptidyl-prolyl cis-trans isomerase [Truepera sp.]|jgi:parvulin-like peptidyl-prolyl isomerase|nr:peptidyl-prolyl cis-trans isomerase [Truepera sp.]HRN17953.1 peptidyl-prolyl cis-trans isomerase [Trueperaceae bacterium]HRQ10052.1 peptidyl-prolyl cis-trans isomerase [Trueperaceae bacterium]
MKLSKRTNTIILWGVSIGLLAGMVVMFTPGLGGSVGGASKGAAQIVVNGQTLYDADLQQIRSNPLFNTVTEGEVGKDLQRLMVDEIVRNTVLDQAAARVAIGNGQVRAAVNDFRAERGVDGARNDQAYLRLIGSSGFNDQSFREYMKGQLKLQEWESRLVKDVTVSDAEVQAYYESHLSSYQSEERILAREIVVADKDLAERLRREALAGADFATLARENSLELADRDGAIGAAGGETEPKPVGRPALPTVVANAAFSLRGAGVTDVITYNDRYYVIEVEGYEPAADRPFDDVKETVAADALNAKKSGVVEAELERLRKAAQVSFPPTSTLSFDNPVVATVGDHEIHAAELDRALYTNTQIQQALSPQTADLIVGLFKPTVLNQLIDTEVAYQSAGSLGQPFVGTRNGIAQAALNFVARDATASEADIEKYYSENQSQFTISAEATVTKAEFAEEAAAEAFREALLAGDDVTAANETLGGTVTELGRVKPGDLPTELDTALFGTDAFDDLPGGSLAVSDVLVLEEPVEAAAGDDEADAAAADDTASTSAASAAGDQASAGGEATDAGATGDDTTAADATAADATGTDATGADATADADAAGDGEPDAAPVTTKDTYVVLVADRLPARVRPLADVRAQVEQAVLAQKRQAERSAWLDEQRAKIEIVETSKPDLVLPTDTAPGTGDAGGGGEAPPEQAPDAAPSGDSAPQDEAAPGAAN